MTTVFYILVALCLMFEVLNLVKVKKDSGSRETVQRQESGRM